MYKVGSNSKARTRVYPGVGTTKAAALDPSRRGDLDGGIANGHSSELMASSPKPVFKKSSKQTHQTIQSPQFSQGHEEMIHFVQSSWQQLMKEYESSRSQGSDRVVYYDQTFSSNNNTALSDFKPLDLEEWFVSRLLKNMQMDPSITV